MPSLFSNSLAFSRIPGGHLLEIQQSILGPNQPLEIPITSTTLDLTTLTAPTLSVLRPDATTVTWTATVQAGATATAATLLYVFVAGDLTTGAAAWLDVWRVTPFGVIASNPVEFQVVLFRLVDTWGRRNPLAG